MVPAPETFARTKRTFKKSHRHHKKSCLSEEKAGIFVLLQEIRIARVLAVIAPVRFRGHTGPGGGRLGHSAVLVPVEEQEERLRHAEHDAQHQKQHAVAGVKGT